MVESWYSSAVPAPTPDTDRDTDRTMVIALLVPVLGVAGVQSLASPMDLDLARFAPKLQRDHPTYFRNADIATHAITEYQKFLRLPCASVHARGRESYAGPWGGVGAWVGPVDLPTGLQERHRAAGPEWA